jgi:hypothetical protein
MLETSKGKALAKTVAQSVPAVPQAPETSHIINTPIDYEETPISNTFKETRRFAISNRKTAVSRNQQAHKKAPIVFDSNALFDPQA